MKPTICLNMIVKNECFAIQRCLASVKPLICSWVIVDTGSTDGTQALIQEFLKNIPGKLIEEPWVDFATNRNSAIVHARGMGDYLLFMDADDVLELAPHFKMPPLDKDYYYFGRMSSGISIYKPFIVNNNLPWTWEGIIHETLLLPPDRTYGFLKGINNIRNVSNDGARARNPNTYLNDAKLIEGLLAKDPQNSRYQFFLAQSYNAAQDTQKALENYLKRAFMPSLDEQETYWALFQIGVCREKLQMPRSTIVESYKAAYKYRPTRIEALYCLAKLYREQGDFETAYDTARLAITLPDTLDTQFVATWMYEYGLLLEFAKAAEATRRPKEAYMAAEEALKKPTLPFPIRMQFDKIRKKITGWAR